MSASAAPETTHRKRSVVPRCASRTGSRKAGHSVTGMVGDLDDADAQRRREAAQKYRPERIRLLLVAHAPPDSIERYFYFEDVREKDDLFRYVVSGLFGSMPDRADKRMWLGRLRDAGSFVVDLVEQPITHAVVGRSAKVKDFLPFVPGLIDRARALEPEHIVLIKTDVYDAAFCRLRDAGLPVVDRRMPFPTSGRQKELAHGFSAALRSVGWTS